MIFFLHFLIRHIRVISVKKTPLGFKTTSNALKEQPDEHIIATMGKQQISSSSKLTPNIMLLPLRIIVYPSRKALWNWVTLTNIQMLWRPLNPEKNEKLTKCSKIFWPCKLSLIIFLNKTNFFGERNSYAQFFSGAKSLVPVPVPIPENRGRD